MSLSSVRSETALGRVPHLVAADSAFYSTKNEDTAKVMGVKRVSTPNRSTKSPERKCEQKKRWFRNGQKWRTGCDGRISGSSGGTGSTAADTKAMPGCSVRPGSV